MVIKYDKIRAEAEALLESGEGADTFEGAGMEQLSDIIKCVLKGLDRVETDKERVHLVMLSVASIMIKLQELSCDAAKLCGIAQVMVGKDAMGPLEWDEGWEKFSKPYADALIQVGEAVGVDVGDFKASVTGKKPN